MEAIIRQMYIGPETQFQEAEPKRTVVCLIWLHDTNLNINPNQFPPPCMVMGRHCSCGILGHLFVLIWGVCVCVCAHANMYACVCMYIS
jgi:hypothetical protein